MMYCKLLKSLIYIHMPQAMPARYWHNPKILTQTGFQSTAKVEDVDRSGG